MTESKRIPVRRLPSSSQLVYKYRALDRNSISILVDRQLHFSSPENLNDPHDCHVEISAALLASLCSIDISTVPPDRVRGLLTAKAELERDENAIRRKLLRDKARRGICSMSFAPDSPLMWAHYADDHRGFCLGFRPYLVLERKKDLDHVLHYPVRYWDQNPMALCLHDFMHAGFYSSGGKGEPGPSSLYLFAVEAAIATKSRAWAYEYEFRFIRDRPGTMQFDPSALDVVILGCRMSARDRGTILRLLSNPVWSHVSVCEVVRNSHSPTFSIRNLNA